MARGQVSKQAVADKILATFGDSFAYNKGKEIRIPMVEDGELVQIKVVLTCAKVNVEQGEDTVLPGAKAAKETVKVDAPVQTIAEPTSAEMDNVINFMDALGL